MDNINDADINKAKRLLTPPYTIAIVKGDEVITASERGVKTLLSLYRTDANRLQGASVADKVIGKAAATLMVMGGVKRVFTHTISEAAQKVFQQHGIQYEAEAVVPVIINRAGDGICPLEQATSATNTLEESYKAIVDTIKILMTKK